MKRYTIGMQVCDKSGNAISGLYVLDEMDFPYILRFQDHEKNRQMVGSKDRVYVFRDIRKAIKFVQDLSKIYRYEFHDRAKNANVSVRKFHFFPLRLSSKTFSDRFSLGEKFDTVTIGKWELYQIVFK